MKVICISGRDEYFQHRFGQCMQANFANYGINAMLVGHDTFFALPLFLNDDPAKQPDYCIVPNCTNASHVKDIIDAGYDVYHLHAKGHGYSSNLYRVNGKTPNIMVRIDDISIEEMMFRAGCVVELEFDLGSNVEKRIIDDDSKIDTKVLDQRSNLSRLILKAIKNGLS